MQQTEPIELEFTVDESDYRRAALFLASGKRRSVSAWPPRRLASLVLMASSLFFCTLQVQKQETFWGSTAASPLFATDLFLFAVLAYTIVGPTLVNSWLARRSVGACGPRIVTLTEEGFTCAAADMWDKRRWKTIDRVDTLRGDIYMIGKGMPTVLIPMSTFASLTDSAQVYELIRMRVDDAKSMAPTGDADNVWPPNPRIEGDDQPVGSAGPEIAADDAFRIEYDLSEDEEQGFTLRSSVSAVSGRKVRQTLTTDFATLRINSHDFSTAYLATALYRIKLRRGYVEILTGPQKHRLIPVSAFPSEADAHEFATRLAAAARSGKRVRGGGT